MTKNIPNKPWAGDSMTGMKYKIGDLPTTTIRYHSISRQYNWSLLSEGTTFHPPLNPAIPWERAAGPAWTWRKSQRQSQSIVLEMDINKLQHTSPLGGMGIWIGIFLLWGSKVRTPLRPGAPVHVSPRELCCEVARDSCAPRFPSESHSCWWKKGGASWLLNFSTFGFYAMVCHENIPSVLVECPMAMAPWHHDTGRPSARDLCSADSTDNTLSAPASNHLRSCQSSPSVGSHDFARKLDPHPGWTMMTFACSQPHQVWRCPVTVPSSSSCGTAFEDPGGDSWPIDSFATCPWRKKHYPAGE